jgi:hypothetical protein
MSKLLFALAALCLSANVFAQTTGIVQGTVRDANTQETLPGALIVVVGSEPQVGVVSDIDGNYSLRVAVGSYNIKAVLTGYQELIKFNINVTSGNANTLNFELKESVTDLQGVEVISYRSIDVSTIETPLSTQRLSTEEIRSNPGGNFDISKVVQALPGVGGSTGSGGFRNDIIIRGGAPNENVYYLDGIEVPQINHFATQGSAGGPAGILNVSFIEDVTLSTSAFEARYDNTLSSVLQFKQREGNRERLQGNIRLSATELATTLEGPLGKKTTFIASARRSYLQLLFKALDLPIRPNFWDFQYKVTHKLNEKTTITALGIGAIDIFSFAATKNSTPENEYIIRATPGIEQDSYTVGFGVKRLLENGFLNVAVSRNFFNNRLDQFEDARNGDEAFRKLKLRSFEIENKLRVDVNKYIGKWKYSYGGVAQYVEFRNNFFNVLRKQIVDAEGTLIQPGITINSNSLIGFWRYGFFAQVSRMFWGDRLSLSAGVRNDMNTFTDNGKDPLASLSPRLAASYALSENWKINGSVGRYYKLPIYSVLGYRDANGDYVNRHNEYIKCSHSVLGIEYIPRPSTRITVEGFLKQYDNYPVSSRDGISLANQGGGFGFVGNETVQSIGVGRARGVELFVQQKLTKRVFAVFSYTFVNSEFAGKDLEYKPSAWDNRHLVSAIFGYKFEKGWEIGAKFRFAGGSPFTPYDSIASRINYATLGTGVLDFNQLNTQRLEAFRQFDLRVDKKWNREKTTIDLFLDIQNLFLFQQQSYPDYTFKRNDDNTGFATTDGQPLAANGSNAIPVILENKSLSVTPAIGFIVEF